MARTKAARKPSRGRARGAAWRDVLRSRTPARRTSARLVLDALLLDAMTGRLETEITRALEMQIEAGKLAQRASTLMDQVATRITQLDDEIAKRRIRAWN